MDKLQKNDEVMIMSGKDKGKRGKVERVFRKIGLVVVGGMNVYKRHQKARQTRGGDRVGGIVEFSRPLPRSSIRVVCPKCNKPARVHLVVEHGSARRVCIACKEVFI